jgi:hypothetical protein
VYAELSAQPSASVAFSNAVQNFSDGSDTSLLCSVGISNVFQASTSELSFDGSVETHKLRAGLPPAMNVAPLGRLTARGRAESRLLGASCIFQLCPRSLLLAKMYGTCAW